MTRNSFSYSLTEIKTPVGESGIVGASYNVTPRSKFIFKVSVGLAQFSGRWKFNSTLIDISGNQVGWSKTTVKHNLTYGVLQCNIGYKVKGKIPITLGGRYSSVVKYSGKETGEANVNGVPYSWENPYNEWLGEKHDVGVVMSVGYVLSPRIETSLFSYFGLTNVLEGQTAITSKLYQFGVECTIKLTHIIPK